MIDFDPHLSLSTEERGGGGEVEIFNVNTKMLNGCDKFVFV